MSIQRFLNYLNHNGFEDVCYYLILPWLLSFVAHCVDDSFVTAILHYGMLLSILNISRLSGYFISSVCFTNRITRFPLLLIFIGFFILSISNRLLVVSICLFLIGFGGSMIGSHDSYSTDINVHTDNLDSNGQLRQHTSDTIHTATDTHRYDIIIQRQIIIFTFIILISGNTYAEERLYPNILPCLLGCIWALCIFIIRCIQVWVSPNSYYQRFKSNNTSSSGYSTNNNSNNNVFSSICTSIALYIRGNNTPSTTNTSISKKSTNDIESGLNTNTKQSLTLQPKKGPKPEFSLTLFTGPLKESYLKYYKNNIQHAQAAYIKTLEWRYEYDIDNILNIYQSTFKDICTYYPHMIHGVAKDGTVVLYEVSLCILIVCVYVYMLFISCICVRSVGVYVLSVCM